MKYLFRTFLFSLVILISGCGDSSIDGEYKAVSGKVGIYQMNSMSIQKTSDKSKFNIKFSGDDRTLNYENVEFKDGELKISDKGFTLPVKISGKKATVQQGSAIFEKISK